MAAEYTIETQSPVTPELRIGYRVSVGARCLAARTTPGLIGIEIRRGDGAGIETYPTPVDFRLYGPVAADTETEISLAAIDLLGTGSYPRTYQMRVVAVGGGADIRTRDVNLATSPYSEPGLAPP